MEKRTLLQHHITSGRFTLPVCITASALLWWLDDGASPLNIAGWAVCLLTTYVLAETDNVQQLIRVRSRMLCCVWLFVASLVVFLHPLMKVQLPALCLSASYYLLFRCYQRYEPVVDVFHCFLFQSVSSLLFPPMLVLSIPMLIYLWRLMFVRSWRTFWAFVLGLALPYIVWSSWCVLTGHFEPLIAHFLPLYHVPQFETAIYRNLFSPDLLPFALISMLMLLGAIHHLTTSFADKIRVRHMLRVFIFQSLLFMALPAVLPESLPTLTSLLLVSSAPLIAHFFSLVENRFTNILFCIVLLAFLVLAFLPYLLSL